MLSKKINKPVLILLLFNGISACFAGLALMIDPSGRWIGLSLTKLRFLPFTNYFIPGLLLFLAIGLTNMFTAYRLIKHSTQVSHALILTGSVSLGWVIVQSSTIPNPLLEWIYGTVALALIVSGVIQVFGHSENSIPA